MAATIRQSPSSCLQSSEGGTGDDCLDLYQHGERLAEGHLKVFVNEETAESWFAEGDGAVVWRLNIDK